MNSEYILNADDLKDIDTSSVDLCRHLRRYAAMGKEIVFDKDRHCESLYSLYLVNFIESEIKSHGSGRGFYSIEDYMKHYLLNIQPFMIRPEAFSYNSDSMEAVIDGMYEYPLYVKIKKTEALSYKYVPVFADEEYKNEWSNGEKDWNISFTAVLGMTDVQIDVMHAKKTENNYFIVKASDIEHALRKKYKDMLDDMMFFVTTLPIPPRIDAQDEIFFSETFIQSVESQVPPSVAAYGYEQKFQSMLSYFIDFRLALKANRGTGKPDFVLEDFGRLCSTLLMVYVSSCEMITQDTVHEAMDFLVERYAANIQTHDTVKQEIQHVVEIISAVASLDNSDM